MPEEYHSKYIVYKYYGNEIHRIVIMALIDHG